MAKRTIALTDEKGRDAQVEMSTPSRSGGYSYVAPDGTPVASERFIKSTEENSYDALLDEHGDAVQVGEALIEGDPEIDLEQAGRRVGDADRVWVKDDGTILHCARTLLVKYDPDGNEVSREELVDVDATVSEEEPLQWTGRLFPIDEVVRRFALVRKFRLNHVNGLTFDFLYEMAKELHESGKMLFVGSGKKGSGPLIFRTNGSPYRGFLQGKVEGDAYLLVLHLSNLELKSVTDDEEE
jgi:hypothetical protein